MAFMTISTWDWSNVADETAALARARQNMEALKEAGASGMHLARLSPDQIAVVAIYPDEAARDRVQGSMCSGSVRKRARTLRRTCRSEVAGEVLISV